jgi:hypothetical protein
MKEYPRTLYYLRRLPEDQVLLDERVPEDHVLHDDVT